MTNKESAYAAQIFQRQCAGVKMTAYERTALQGLLERMDEAERTGCIAAIIRIMLEGEQVARR